MTQIGEAVSFDMFVNDEHDEKTCPWHSNEKTAEAKPMDLQSPDEDTDAMPKNLGTALGKNLDKDKKKSEVKKKNTVSIFYTQGSVVTWQSGRKRKRAQSYVENTQEVEYELQYAPHHLIPGNESLKGSKIVNYLGDDDVIKNYKKRGNKSEIKKGQSVGYDVNQAENGVWLPSPYALSNTNQWPSIKGIQVILKRLGEIYHDQTEEFKHAYVAAAIEVSGGRQFHMRHTDYSNEVRDILDAMGTRIKLMSQHECPVAKKNVEKEKYDAPVGLTAHLNLLSANLERFLIGNQWHKPLYADNHMMEEYIKSLEKVDGLKAKIKKVL